MSNANTTVRPAALATARTILAPTMPVDALTVAVSRITYASPELALLAGHSIAAVALMLSA